jgi:hypothetical protein
MRRHATGVRPAPRLLVLGLVLAGLVVAGCTATSPAPRPAASAGRPAGAGSTRPAGVPGCSAPAASGPRLPAAGTSFVLVGGVPFGVLVSPDGRRAFVSSTGQQLQVMDAGSRPVLSPAGTLLAPGVHLAGETLTRDGRYLLAASDSGAVVFSTARAGQASPRAMLGSLQRPAGTGRPAGGPLGDGAIEVAVPGGDRRSSAWRTPPRSRCSTCSGRWPTASAQPTTWDPFRPVWPRSGWPCPRTAGGSTRPAR